MAKLKPVDILGVTQTPEDPKPDTSISKAAVTKKAAAHKPSPYETDLRAKLRDKVQFNVGAIPRFVSEIYEAQAKAAGMNKREYFYHLLREKEGDIPKYSDMDGRKL